MPKGEFRSLSLDVRRLDNGPPFLDLGLLKRAERLRRLLVARNDLLTEAGELLARCRIRQNIGDRRVELGDDRLRRGFRRPDRIPDRTGEIGQSGLGGRRDFRRRRQAAPAGKRKGLDVACMYLWQRGDLVGDDHINLTSQQVLYGRRAAAIMNELKAGAGDLFEKDTEDVLWAAHARGAGKRFFRSRLRPGNELLQVIRR